MKCSLCTAFLLLVVVEPVCATRLPLVSFDELRSKADVVLVGRVDSSTVVEEESEVQVELFVLPETVYVGTVDFDSKGITIRVSGGISPVRVGKAGLFFLSFDLDTGVYLESSYRMSALERVNFFCGTERSGGWESAYVIVRNGEFLTEVPDKLVFNRADCIPELSNQSPLISDAHLSHLSEF